jgi:hypothetical protein
MRLVFTLSILFLSLSLLLLQSNSFTSAEVKNEAILSIVSEENALIAITYEKGEMLIVTNNTGKTIEIEKVELMGETNQKNINLVENNSPSIQPGGVKEFPITGNLKDLAGRVIQIKSHWYGGSAEIKSIIPELHEVQKEG